MSAIRYERPSRMMSPSSPSPRGGAPMRARSSVLIPLVMKRSIRPFAPDDAEGGIVGPDEAADSIDDELEDGLEVQDRGDLACRVDERLELADGEQRRLGLGLGGTRVRVHVRQSTSGPLRAGGQSARRLGAGRHFRASRARRNPTDMRIRIAWSRAMNAAGETGVDPRVDGAPRTIRTILLASDLSPASAAAESLAFELAANLGSSVLLVSVIDPRGLSLPGGGFRQRVDQARSARETAAQTIVDRGRREGVSIRCLIWEGDPGESIVEAAAAEGVDLIVVGSHGRRGIDRFFMGSVSEHVVRDAPVPVLVARSPAP